MVAEGQGGGRHAEHNAAGAVNDKERGGIWWWGPIGSTGLPCIGKREVDGRATLAVECASSVAYEGVEPCWRRVGAANSRIVKTIRRYQSAAELEMMFVPCGSPIYLEAVIGAGGIGVGSAMDFKAMRHTPRSTGLEHASTASHEWSGGRTDRDSGQRHQRCKYGPSPTGFHRMIPLIYKTTYGSRLRSRYLN